MGPFQTLAIALVLLAVSGIAALWAFQRYAIYRFPDTRVAPDGALSNYQATEFRSGDGTPLVAWVSPPEGDGPVLVAFGGNYVGIDAMARHLSAFTESGIGVALLGYRGANGAPGQLTEAAIKADAIALYDAVDSLLPDPLPAARRVIYGYSLGTSPAVHLARKRDAAGLIIEAGFDRLCRFQRQRLKGVPMCTLMWTERHDVINEIGAVSVPLLMGHGRRDEALSIAWAEALFSAANENKTFRDYSEGTHTNLLEQGFVTDVKTFLAIVTPARDR